MLVTRCSSITCIYGGKRIGHEHAVGSNRCSLKRGILGSDWHPESRRVNGLRFEIKSKFRSQFQVLGFTFFNDSSGGANGGGG